MTQTAHLTIASRPSQPQRRPFISLRKIGGLYHWRVGSIGGSFYRSAAA